MMREKSIKVKSSIMQEWLEEEGKRSTYLCRTLKA